MSEYQLTREILARSFAQTWAGAKLEWELAEVSKAGYPDVCLCGHSPIIELCVIVNKVTKHEVIVGNCCARKFLGLAADKIAAALERVRKDPRRSLNAEAIAYACLQDGLDHRVGEEILPRHHGQEGPQPWPAQQEDRDQRKSRQEDASV